MLQRITEEF